ncbi:uncharacterized protein [Lolium perenne]|uniref:uncharacterized protein n=1 Tax=Lolium perenne TaxID=4522 RepID=UPI0021F53D6D|nr:uncharacterized protein LOC127343129 [Lolium perenne]
MASMERQLQRQDQPINMTAALEALSPLLNNPRRTVVLAEAFTSGVMALLLLQLILGSYRRQTSSVWVQAGTWATYTLSFPAIAYTLGLMQSSPVKNVMYPVWAVSLLLAAGCTNAVKVYELGDNKQWIRSFFNYYQYTIYSAMICWLLYPTSLNAKEYLYFAFKMFAPSTYFKVVKNPAVAVSSLTLAVVITAFMGRELACLMVERGYFCVRRVAKFMNNLPANDDGFDPLSMRGYKYPVHFRICTEANVITIDQIWQCEGRLLLRSGSTTDQCCVGLKDVCLAYAMYQLLKRRYYGMACAEEHLDETRDFVFKGLLHGTDDDYETAFRIVEVELGFCHDYFFTKHAIIFELETGFFILFVLRIMLILVVAYFVWLNSLSVKTPTAIIEVHSRRVDAIITVLVLVTVLLIELLQATFYMASDWCKVSVACRYVTGSWYQGNAFFEKLMGYLSRFTIFRHWKDTVDQYSVFSNPNAAHMAAESDLQAVKLAIVRSLRSCDGLPTNGEGSLRRNGVFAEFSWALQGQAQAEIMLVWHIATEHVNAKSENGEATELHRQVAVCLSRYCVYLMDSAPELLPGYFGDTKSAMCDVKEDVSKVSRSRRHGSQDPEDDGSILMTGVKLGKQLDGIVDRWKVLADFWTEKILYVAPSDNVKAHMEGLANGGELLTHVWVLLTHAGIHKINREEGRNSTMPSQPSQGSV